MFVETFYVKNRFRIMLIIAFFGILNEKDLRKIDSNGKEEMYDRLLFY